MTYGTLSIDVPFHISGDDLDLYGTSTGEVDGLVAYGTMTGEELVDRREDACVGGTVVQEYARASGFGFQFEFDWLPLVPANALRAASAVTGKTYALAFELQDGATFDFDAVKVVAVEANPKARVTSAKQGVTVRFRSVGEQSIDLG